MRKVPPSHLGALLEGYKLLRRHPAMALGLALLAMVLAQLAPALELAAGVGPSLIFQPIFGFTALLRLKHPAFWFFNFLGGLLNLWISCSLLALYHRLEALVAAPS